MLYKYQLQTTEEHMYNIIGQVREAIVKSGVVNGLVMVYCPHTTAAITINENSDPAVIQDMLLGLNKAFPDDDAFRHGEGNSAAHLKASVIGASETFILENGRLLMGSWQGIYFCEFDPPRLRLFFVKVIQL
ncbi:MAG: secondary thiamine-phosphate synthase enzyme YjbQ [Defluviitaleaceae bacterium]|nr:secondary thiamine-phosphate synthase enzyme YjbQ [Defluviitaleaceae bacterium]